MNNVSQLALIDISATRTDILLFRAPKINRKINTLGYDCHGATISCFVDVSSVFLWPCLVEADVKILG